MMTFLGFHHMKALVALRSWALAMMIMSCMFPAVEKADAANALTVADVQCIVVGAGLSESADQTQRMSGVMLLTYFLGRIDGRSPNADLEALIKREAQKMSASDIANAAHRCGKEFSARGPEMVRIGRALERIGK